MSLKKTFIRENFLHEKLIPVIFILLQNLKQLVQAKIKHDSIFGNGVYCNKNVKWSQVT